MRTAAIWFGGLAVICVCFGLYYFGDQIGSLQPGATGSSFGQPWVLFEQGMQAILAGTWFYDYALAPLSPHALVVWVVLALFSAGAMASLAGGRSRSLAVSALAVSTLLIAVQNLLTPQATAGWHYISVYPFVTIVAAYGAYAIASVLPRRKATSYAALACVAASALTYNGLLMGRYFDALPREPANSAWSPAVYKLSRDLQMSHAPIFTADWGILNPLFALHPSHRYTKLGLHSRALRDRR